MQPGRAAGVPVAAHVGVAFALDAGGREVGYHLDGVKVVELVVVPGIAVRVHEDVDVG